MGNGPHNVAKGRFIQWYENIETNNPANSAFIIVLATGAATDATLRDYQTLSALLGDAGVTEATFTNYGRKTLTDADLAPFPGPDNANDRYDVTLPDQTWAQAGGTVDNTLTRLYVCYDPDTTSGTDANIITGGFNDFAVTTNGGDLTADFAAVYYRAS